MKKADSGACIIGTGALLSARISSAEASLFETPSFPIENAGVQDSVPLRIFNKLTGR